MYKFKDKKWNNIIKVNQVFIENQDKHMFQIFIVMDKAEYSLMDDIKLR